MDGDGLLTFGDVALAAERAKDVIKVPARPPATTPSTVCGGSPGLLAKDGIKVLRAKRGLEGGRARESLPVLALCSATLGLLRSLPCDPALG
jgi:hypothetical protein